MRDNGVGGASLDAGTGVLGIADRVDAVDAVGGRVTVDAIDPTESPAAASGHHARPCGSSLAGARSSRP